MRTAAAATTTWLPARARARAMAANLRAVRHELVKLMLQPAGDADAHSSRLRELTAKKESLERNIAQALKQQPTVLTSLPSPDDLRKQLPAHMVFIDFLRSNASK